MKVVLFCGGLGTRLREHTETTPKPLVNIGRLPILVHLMTYYAHFGHREFILCLGHMGEQIEQYFSGDSAGVSEDLDPFDAQGSDWQITFANTGTDANIGERLRAVEHLLPDDTFLANYSDGLADVPLDDFLNEFRRKGKVASFLSVRPYHSFHTVTADSADQVTGITPAGESDIWLNGGFFAFRREIFDYLKDGEELVEEPFQRLINARELITYRHDGFWACMDTYKDKKAFDAMQARGDLPWQPWDR